ncbi:RNA polymerase sigma factor [Conexibacter sp. SYSU D00693]|uniref:RNA polymerase sigma factor n=1 Tax=Conexibacter sp. SYSU D00693 TaxID=2812560 RepID=UPI00196A86D4|nr:RNA polymerase sigma factor [Conexibacter sp. SYSU D00693]
MPRLLDPDALPRHLDRLHRAAWAMTGDPVDADDLVQETCARVLARPRMVQPEDEVGYLLSALRNTFVSRWRSASRRAEVVGIPEGLEAADHAGAEALEDRVRAREVLSWIAELPDALAAPLVAVDVAGLSIPEAAAALDVGKRETHVRLLRARAAIGPRLRPRGMAATA